MLMNSLARTIELLGRNLDEISWMFFYLGKYEIAYCLPTASDFRHDLCQQTLDLLSTCKDLLSTIKPAKAAIT
jgi:hypothetical protein